MKSHAKRTDARKANRRIQKRTLSKILSCSALNSFGVLIALVAFLAVVILALVAQPSARAANPTNGTLSLTSAPVTWKGTAIGGGAQNDLGTGVIGSEDLCQEGVTCDTYTLTISGTPADWANARKLAHVHLGWTIPTQDFDLYIHKGDLSGPIVAKSGNGITNGILTSEDADLDPSSPSVGTGTFAVHVVYWAATSAEQYSATATVNDVPATGTSHVSTETAPRFFNYADPYNDEWGEPSLGVNWKSGNVMFISALSTLRIGFDDAVSPAKANWSDKSFLSTSLVTLDPILFTDSPTGRTFATQLVSGLGYGVGCSLTAYTDDDGETWIQSEGCGLPTSGGDHESLGAGPFATPLTGGTPVYSHSVYYCSQASATAFCARSDDGGLTFGPGVPIYTLLNCGGLHGHVKIAPDGTVYVPNRSCGGQQAMAISHDNGISWTLKTAPNSVEGVWDPSVGIASDGTVYFGYENAGKTPRIAVYDPKTDQWINDQPVGGLTNFTGVAFPAVVAGDGDRAAFAFLGTTTPGSAFGSGTDFTGTWHLYVATTYDRGYSYTFSDATPTDPVQRGNVCDGGSGCPSNPVNTRNLLDFMDVQIDKKGRVVVGYADGCITNACIQGLDVSGPNGQPDGVVDSYDNDHRAIATISRQAGGKGLLQSYDSELARKVPAAPDLVASSSAQSANLVWTTPDDGGSAITGYNIYRGVGTGPDILIASVGGDINTYADNSGGANYYYAVRANNANGAGALSPRVNPTPLETACVLPGITVAKDPGDNAPNTPAVPQVNLQSVSIAEPYLGGAQKLVFTVKLAAGGTLPANSQWYVMWDRPKPDANYSRDYVAMRTDLLGSPTFEYGRINYPLQYTSPAANQGNIPTKLGSADAGTYDAVNGTIQITVMRSLLDDDSNIGLGRMLNTIEGRTYLGRNDMGPINQNASSDYTGDGTYTIAGNDACQLPPAAPTNLTATSPSKGVITLNWLDNSNNETGFSVERSTSLNAGFVEIAQVGVNTISYTDRTVARKTTYYYRVRALRGTARSGYSNVAAGRTK